MTYWWGLAASTGTPPEIIARLNRASARPRLRNTFTQQAATAAASTPDEMKELLVCEIAPWPGVTTRAKISIKS
jgi:tripartite-type tricarboxylate transporter receptor subunit TctC